MSISDRRHEDKTCQDCRCRDCEILTAVIDRLDTWKAAKSALLEANFNGEENSVGPIDILILSNWLWSGESPIGD